MRRIQLIFPEYFSLQWLQEKVNTHWTTSAILFIQNWVELTEDRDKEKIPGENLASFFKEERFRQLFFTSIETEGDSKKLC